MKKQQQIAVFASGSGSNARAIIEFFRNDPSIGVAAVFCNNPAAGVIAIARAYQVPVILFGREELRDGTVARRLVELEIGAVVLAGFLWKVPENITRPFSGRIINIHPALLPKFGGKGMYGMNVHRAVFEEKETETGITIHFVNEHYDEGDILLQEKLAIGADDSPESIALKVQELEHRFYPQAIRALMKNLD